MNAGPIMLAAAPVDADRVDRLTFRLLRVMREHLAAGQASRDPVYESLNALAFCVSVQFAGTDFDPAAIAFFERALAEQNADFKAEASAVADEQDG